MADATLGAEPASVPRRARRLLLPLLLFALLAAVPLVWGADRYVLGLASRAMIYGLAALSLDLILGFGALVSFGHAAFLGIGAYAVGIAMEHGLRDALLSMPLAMAAGALFAAATGAIALRTRGVYFIMITLAFGQMAFFTAQSLARYGGDDGLRLARRSEIAGFRLLDGDIAFFYAVLGILVLAWLFLGRVTRSRFGRVLRGAKENERRMRALGFDPFRVRLTAYALSGALCALAGALLANRTLFVSPALMSWQTSGELIVMVVLGGIATLGGAVLGGVSVILIEEFLAQLGGVGRSAGAALGAIVERAAAALGFDGGSAGAAVAGFVEKLATQWKILFGVLIVLLALYAKGGLARLFERRPER